MEINPQAQKVLTSNKIDGEKIMVTTPKTIEPLQRIVATLQAGSCPDRTDLTPSPLQLDFITGIRPDGLNAFEAALFQHAVGDRFTVEVAATEIAFSFSHILPPSALLSLPGETAWLHVHVLEVLKPEPRDVVAAMAAVANEASCGGGGDCGCGCGAH